MASQRVIAFLALHGYPLERAYVAGKLWFQTRDCNAHACLRSALWRLNKCCPERCLVEATRTQLRLSLSVAIDVRERVALARQMCDRSIPIADAIDYRRVLEGGLLLGWYDDWVLLERERLDQIGLHALEAVSERLTEAGRYAEAVETALAALAVDPLRESTHHTLIKTYLAEGNRASAIRQYRTYRQLLKKTLDLEPAGELEALMRGLSMTMRGLSMTASLPAR